LSKRREDILPLADHFRKQANKKNGRSVKSFSPDLRKWLLDFHWKGNVRQLKNVIESLVVMDIDDLLDMDDLSPDLYDGPTSSIAAGSAEAKEGDQQTSGSLAAIDGDSSSLVGKSLKEIERWAIEHTLTLANHNREETANILGISERNLYRKLKEYDLR
jgi:two-component system response regulator HydG